MYAQQKSYAKLAFGETTTVTSSMIWGSQWDQIMIWMKEVENETSYAGTSPFYVINSQGMGNFGTSAGGTGSIANTGYYAVKNIYDLAGNEWEWTQEQKGTDSIYRGGGFNYNGDDTPASHRDYFFDPTDQHFDLSFRVQLYINV